MGLQDPSCWCVLHPTYTVSPTVGWTDFLEEEKIGHLPVVPNRCQTPIPKYQLFLKVAYFWGARPLKILPETLNSATNKFFGIRLIKCKSLHSS